MPPDAKSAELAEEQAYFDRADKHRRRHRDALADAATAAANPASATWLRKFWRSSKDKARPHEAVAFGRIDNQAREPLYIGHELIRDDHHEVLVVNWQASAARPFYEATVDNPLGVSRKRTFDCRGNTILDFADVIFQRIREDLAVLDGPDAPLLSELDRARDGAMHDIAATIRAAQYELIRSPLDQVLVIEGGPGTGKTAVALHRVSWLLYNHRDRLAAADVLVVGPTPAFTRYIRTVLPELGDTEVVHADLGQLAPPVTRGRAEPPAVSRLKGDPRMAGLLARALQARIGSPEPAERLLFDGRFVTLPGVEVQSIVDTCRSVGTTYNGRRELLRQRLAELAVERGAPTTGNLAPLDNLIERLWPQFSAASFLHGLLASRRRLAAAAGDEFTAEEVGLLLRRGADRLSEQTWSEADLPLLDEVDALLRGTDRRYGHIVVDEAQDLSPMQLRSIARRCATGSLTVVGDLAQSTGAWARDGWSEVLAHLPAELPHRVATLRYGYRVPRRVYDLAARLLPVAAPGLAPLEVVRDGPADPGIHRVDPAHRPARAAELARRHAAAGRYVGLICPASLRQELANALTGDAPADDAPPAGGGRQPPADAVTGGPQPPAEGSVHLLTPPEAKGLEFDTVIVVEPEEIVAGDDRGHRMLFIALTRTLRYLEIVCVGEPVPLGPPEPVVQPPAVPGPALDDGQLDGLAEQVAAIVCGAAPAPQWDDVLSRAADILDRQRGTRPPTGRHRRD